VSWQPAGEIVISTSSEFMNIDDLMKTIQSEKLTGYLAFDFPQTHTIFFDEGQASSDIAILKVTLGESPYTAFFHQLPRTLFLLCRDIAESTEVLHEQFKFVYEIYYFAQKVSKTNFRGVLVLRKGEDHFLIFDNGEPILGAKWAGGTFQTSRSLINDIFALGGEVEEVHVFRKTGPFAYFEPKEVMERSGVKSMLILFTRFFSTLRNAFFRTSPMFKALYAPKVEDFESLSRLKVQAQNVYIARGYIKDPTKTIEMVNEFWDIFYKFPKKTNNALFLFRQEGVPAILLFSEEVTNMQESLSPPGVLARLGLSYETRSLGDLMEDMSTAKLKTLLEIYNLATPSEKSLKNLKEEIVIKAGGSY